MNNLAISYADLGRHAEALQLCEETLTLRKAKLGPDHPDTLISMGNLAKSLIQLDRGAEALPIIDECLQRAAGQVGPSRLIPDMLETSPAALREEQGRRRLPGDGRDVGEAETLRRRQPVQRCVLSCRHRRGDQARCEDSRALTQPGSPTRKPTGRWSG